MIGKMIVTVLLLAASWALYRFLKHSQPQNKQAVLKKRKPSFVAKKDQAQEESAVTGHMFAKAQQASLSEAEDVSSTGIQVDLDIKSSL